MVSLIPSSNLSGEKYDGRSHAAIAKLVDLSDTKYLLDVGGGTGAITIKLIEKNPHIYSTIIDFPNVAEIGWDYISKEDTELLSSGLDGIIYTGQKGYDKILNEYKKVEILAIFNGFRVSKLNKKFLIKESRNTAVNKKYLLILNE